MEQASLLRETHRCERCTKGSFRRDAVSCRFHNGSRVHNIINFYSFPQSKFLQYDTAANARCMYEPLLALLTNAFPYNMQKS